MTIREAYEKYRHMDHALRHLSTLDFLDSITKDLWEAVRKEAERPVVTSRADDAHGMSSHQLAKRLLALPDQPVKTWDPYEDELTTVTGFTCQGEPAEIVICIDRGNIHGQSE